MRSGSRSKRQDPTNGGEGFRNDGSAWKRKYGHIYLKGFCVKKKVENLRLGNKDRCQDLGWRSDLYLIYFAPRKMLFWGIIYKCTLEKNDMNAARVWYDHVAQTSSPQLDFGPVMSLVQTRKQGFQTLAEKVGKGENLRSRHRFLHSP